MLIALFSYCYVVLFALHSDFCFCIFFVVTCFNSIPFFSLGLCCSYFLCTYHWYYINHLRVIRIYFRLIKAYCSSHTSILISLHLLLHFDSINYILLYSAFLPILLYWLLCFYSLNSVLELKVTYTSALHYHMILCLHGFIYFQRA